MTRLPTTTLLVALVGFIFGFVAAWVLGAGSGERIFAGLAVGLGFVVLDSAR